MALLLTAVLMTYGGAQLVEASHASSADAPQTFPYSSLEQTYVVPSGITAVQIEAIGGRGGDRQALDAPGSGVGGWGADVTSIVTVIPGETLYIEVGRNGANASVAPGATRGAGDGGAGGPGQYGDSGGEGGAASWVQTCSLVLSTASGGCLAGSQDYFGPGDPRLVVASGGGGAGSEAIAGCNGGTGAGGIRSGDNATYCDSSSGGGGGNGIGGAGRGLVYPSGPAHGGGGGGTLSGPGAGGSFPVAGSPGQDGHGTNGGPGVDPISGEGGGGGGGGYYGGGGGGDQEVAGPNPSAPRGVWVGEGGGAGSSYTASSGGMTIVDDTTGIPLVTITPLAPLPVTTATATATTTATVTAGGGGGPGPTVTQTVTSTATSTATATETVTAPPSATPSASATSTPGSPKHPVTLVAMAVTSPHPGRIHFEVTTNPVVVGDKVSFFHRRIHHHGWRLIGTGVTGRHGRAHPTFDVTPGVHWHVRAVVAAQGPETTHAVSRVEDIHVLPAVQR